MERQGIVIDEESVQDIKDEIDNPLIPQYLLSMVRTCDPENCEHKSMCPLLKKGQPPVTLKCPIDLATIEQMYSGLKTYLDDLDAGNDIAAQFLVKDIIYNQLTLSRMEAIISDDGYFEEIPIPLSKDGSVIEYVSETSKAFEIREKIVDSTAKLYKLLGIDRYNKVRIDKLKLETKIEEEASNKYLSHVNDMHEVMGLLNHDVVIEAKVVEEEDRETKPTPRSKRKAKSNDEGESEVAKNCKPKKRKKKGGK